MFSKKILIVPLMALSFMCQGQSLSYESITMENSRLPDNTILGMGTNGNVKWIGTGKGLARVENNQWQIFTTQNSGLQTNVIHTLAVESNGKLWVGTMFGLSSLENGKWTQYSALNCGLPGFDILSIAIDKNNVKWYGTTKGVGRLSGSTWESWTTSNSNLPNNNVPSICLDANNEPWMITATGVVHGVISKEGKTVDWVPVQNEELNRGRPFRIHSDIEGNVWVATTSNGLFKINSKGAKKVSDVNWAGSVLSEKNGVWIGTWNNRFDYWEFSDTAKESLELREGYISPNPINGVIRDAEGEIWIGTGGGGLQKVARKDIAAISPSNPAVSAVSLYPNPASKETTISFALVKATEVKISILSADGKTVFRVLANKKYIQGQNQEKILLEGLVPGVYMLRVKTVEGEHNEKLFVI